MIQAVTEEDRAFVMGLETHVTDSGYDSRVFSRSGYVIWEDGERIGILSHCMLRDNLPFLNHIFIREAYREVGLGRQAILDREQEMKDLGYKMTLISTQADETAQHLYRKLGYIDCGGLMLHGTPFGQPLEIFFRKEL